MKNNMTATVLVFCCILLFGSSGLATGDGTRAAHSLTTIFAADSYGAGNTFDIMPTRSFQITGIDINVEVPVATYVDVYYKVGTSKGFETNQAPWFRLASGTGTGAGADLPTFIDLPGAAGVTFFAGNTYGIYVDVTNAPYSYVNYTDGNWTTFSNNDLSLTTNSGQSTPAFSGSHPYEMWNGTLYYDVGGPDFPGVDITCNGEQAGVMIHNGTNARLDYDVHAGLGFGFPVDIWIVLNHPFGLLTYDGLGPHMGWNLGLGNAFYTGPLTDMSGTCLDHALGMGSYYAGIAIDTAANGVLNVRRLYTIDVVDFDVVAAPRVYTWDDGFPEDLFGWPLTGGAICWLQGWDAVAGGNTILDVQCLFGTVLKPGLAPGNGTVCDIYVWDDPTDDGDPSDCVLVTTETITVQQVDTDLYNTYPLTTPAVVSGEFYVGCSMQHLPMQPCMPVDYSTPYTTGASWICGSYTSAFDPRNLMNNQIQPEDFWRFSCVRAGY